MSKRANVKSHPFPPVHALCSPFYRINQVPISWQLLYQMQWTWSSRSSRHFGGRLTPTLKMVTECVAFFFGLQRWVDEKVGRTGWVSLRGPCEPQTSQSPDLLMSSTVCCSKLSLREWECLAKVDKSVKPVLELKVPYQMPSQQGQGCLQWKEIVLGVTKFRSYNLLLLFSR